MARRASVAVPRSTPGARRSAGGATPHRDRDQVARRECFRRPRPFDLVGLLDSETHAITEVPGLRRIAEGALGDGTQLVEPDRCLGEAVLEEAHDVTLAER